MSVVDTLNLKKEDIYYAKYETNWKNIHSKL